MCGPFKNISYRHLSRLIFILATSWGHFDGRAVTLTIPYRKAFLLNRKVQIHRQSSTPRQCLFGHI